MNQAQHRVAIAIVFPADPQALAATRVEDTRFAGMAQALESAGAQVISAPFCDEIASEIQARLLGVDLALVWYNPVEAGRDRSGLNAMLRSVAAQGVKVSAHPDVIDKMGTKDVLWQTRQMPWGTDLRRYSSVDAMRSTLPALLGRGSRVLKQMRGQSGDGVWQLSWRDAAQQLLDVRHAKKGSTPQQMQWRDFLKVCEPYFSQGGAMID